jgi:hypothetical protein
MARAYEISIWKPHVGKRAAFLKSWAEIAEIFKSLTDNGIVNDAIGESDAMSAWIEKNKDIDSATMISHDLYTENV